MKVRNVLRKIEQNRRIDDDEREMFLENLAFQVAGFRFVYTCSFVNFGTESLIFRLGQKKRGLDNQRLAPQAAGVIHTD